MGKQFQKRALSALFHFVGVRAAHQPHVEILSSCSTESPQWLEGFYGNFTDWTGLSLQQEENLNLRKRILGRSPSLLDVRNYMFARQSQLLLQMNKPWEVCTLNKN